MSRKISLGAAVSAAAIASAVTVSLTYSYAMNSFNSKVADINERQAMYTKLSEIDQKARQDYIGKINETALTDGICAGYLAGLGDSHAQYLSAQKYKAYLGASKSSNTGVGVTTLQDDDGNMEVIEVMSGSPAEKAGIRQGDTIVAVGGKEIPRITYAAALNELEGTAGTKITLTVLHASASSASSASAAKPEEITVTRGEYTLRTLSYSLINGNVGYIRISQFRSGTASDFNNAVSALVRKRPAGLVIDLRGNAGGLVSGAAAALDTLLPAGNTVESRDKSGKITVEYTSGTNEVDLPISVVVNGGTSGAAELFAEDVRSFKKGLSVGEQTAGNAMKDAVTPLSDGSAMIVSVAEYLPAGGRSFLDTGVGIDINKSLAADQQALLERNRLEPSADAQVQAAVTALARQGAQVQQLPGTQQAASGTASSGASTSSASSAPAATD